MERVDYDGRLSTVYARGRALDPTAVAAWMDAVADHAPRHVRVVADVGSGIGRFTPALGARMGWAVGVEPSGAMRAQSEPAPSARYVGGRAEELPLRSGCVDLAVLFFVWHHVPAKAAAATELARVVRPGGRLLLRTNFADRMPDLWWYRWFPRAAEVDRVMYEPHDAVVSALTTAGFAVVAEEDLSIPGPATAAEDYQRLRARALSTFEHLTEDEIEAGFAAIEHGLEADPPAGPITRTGPLLVLERL